MNWVLPACLLPVLAFAQTGAPSGYFAAVKAEMARTWPDNRTIQIAFLGHSVPSGYLATPIVNNYESYPILILKGLDAKFPYAVKNIIKSCIGGESSAGGKNRIQGDILPFKPDILFIDYALNDRTLGLAQAGTNWKSMIEKTQAAGIKVVLMTPTPDSRENILDDNATLAQHAAQIKSLAAAYKTAVVDCYGAFKQLAKSGKSLGDYMAQNNHPNPKGHQVAADEILKLFDTTAAVPLLPATPGVLRAASGKALSLGRLAEAGSESPPLKAYDVKGKTVAGENSRSGGAGSAAERPLAPIISATALKSFNPGKDWLAIDGAKIDCHGGNIQYREADKTYYWYGEHYGTPRGVSCYSSKDLYNWKSEGVVLEKGSIPILERPKVLYNRASGKFVMWFHYEDAGYTLAHLGVAVSDNPIGPFKIVTHFRPNGHESRDMGVFIDDDGKGYVIYSADHTNLTIRIAELTPDHLNVTTRDADMQAHCEGEGMLKQGGTYYLITSQCSGWAPNQAAYYTATDIMGPWTKKGDPAIGDTQHKTFNSQSGFILQVPGYRDGFIFMGDRWNGRGSTASQYVFLPLTITPAGAMELRWFDEWDLSVFTPSTGIRRSGFGRNWASALVPGIGESSGRVFRADGRNMKSRAPDRSPSAISFLPQSAPQP